MGPAALLVLVLLLLRGGSEARRTAGKVLAGRDPRGGHQRGLPRSQPLSRRCPRAARRCPCATGALLPAGPAPPAGR